MNSGSSAFMASGAQSADASAIAAVYEWSRPSFIATSPEVRSTTSVWTSPQMSNALSTFDLRGVLRPPRGASSAVTIRDALHPSTRAAKASGEKPAKTIE